jgi:hypothetical protein
MNEWTMTQSATGLDISDDESKLSHKKASSSDRGKENIDPNEMSTPPMTRAMAAAAARAEEQEGNLKAKEEPRTPLEELNPAEFYAEGLDATSVVLVHDDEEAETDVEDEAQASHHDFTFQAPPPVPASLSTSEAVAELEGPSLAQVLSSATPNFYSDKAEAPCEPLATSDNQILADADGDVDFGIWESESAKDENEKVDCPGSPSSITGDENAFALQEL